MDGLYGFHTSVDSAAMMMPPTENLILPSDYQALMYSSAGGGGGGKERMVVVSDVFGSDEFLSGAVSALSSEEASITPEMSRAEGDVSFSVIKSKIASHPSYPRLLQAYIDCQKVGAPPELACLLGEIQRESDAYKLDASSSCLGSDPELDEFMQTYCDILVKYKSDLARPFEEATTFLNKVEMQLRNLCTSGASIRGLPDDGVVSSEEELSGGETETQEGSVNSEDRDLKDRLLRKYGSQLSTLKLEFSKKKKKGKLPREARQTLFDWWNVHYKWPYPTEADKIALSEATGLDQKQINNWFINQRKRHWKPSENMAFGIMDDSNAGFFTQD